METTTLAKENFLPPRKDFSSLDAKAIERAKSGRGGDPVLKHILDRLDLVEGRLDFIEHGCSLCECKTKSIKGRVKDFLKGGESNGSIE